jgi:hypothetical protein
MGLPTFPSAFFPLFTSSKRAWLSSARRKVGESNLMMCRSHLHSFWHDDPADPEAGRGQRGMDFTGFHRKTKGFNQQEKWDSSFFLTHQACNING